MDAGISTPTIFVENLAAKAAKACSPKREVGVGDILTSSREHGDRITNRFCRRSHGSL